MKMRKVIAAFLAFICILSSFGILAVGASDSEGTVYATTDESLNQGSAGFLYVYLDDLTDLASLSVSVYYDPEKIMVLSAYNNVECELYDSVLNDGCVQFSYIFNGAGSNTQTNLFYIYYKAKDGAEIGETFFDIVVSEAYTSSLEVAPIVGSRCSLEITEKAEEKEAYVYSNSNIYTSVEEEFELSYSLSTYQIASGSFSIVYDPEIFELVSFEAGEMLNNKIFDVNSSFAGAIQVSFVGIEYAQAYAFFNVKFKTVKNTEGTSEITLNVSEFCDLDLNRVSCKGYTTNVDIAFDDSYTKDAPSVSVSASYSAETGKVTATVTLEKDSRLGAGDFVLSFDPEVLTYESYQKGFSPTFFNINSKNVSSGSFKFMIISMSDITDAQTMITVVFDVKNENALRGSEINISGSGLTDSLTNGISLNFESAKVEIPMSSYDIVTKSEISYTLSGNVITVNHSTPCTVGYLDGDKYVEINAVKNEDGSYSFTIPKGFYNIVVTVLGDVNNDGRLSAVDCAKLNAYVLGKLKLSSDVLLACDTNGDEIVDKDDVLYLLDVILSKSYFD